MRDRDKVKSFRETADKLAVCGHTTMADDYRWAADTIEKLMKQNDIQKEIILEKLNVIAGMDARMYRMNTELEKLRGW